MTRQLMILTLCWAALGGSPVHAQSKAAPAGGELFQFLQAAHRDGPRWVRAGVQWVGEREAYARFINITTGAGPSWVRPAQTRYTWDWLAQRFDGDRDGSISRAEFAGSTAWMDLLDRDRDGRITAVDLDWSENAPLTKASLQAKSVFGMIDDDGNGQLTPEEWRDFHQKLAQDKNYLTQDDLLSLFLPGKRGLAGRGKKANDDTKLARVKAFFQGDVGSWFEGPDLGARAPNFTLPSPNGAQAISLSDSFGKKPVVLVFGSFT